MNKAVSYGLVEEFEGWAKAPALLQSLLVEFGCKRVLEIGSGANTTLSPEFVKSTGVSYVTSDVDQEELKKADDAFEQLVLDLSVSEIDPSLHGSFDCIFSRMVGEHIRDGRQYHKNIYNMLRPGGHSVHCFSTLWAVPFAANRLLPDTASRLLLNMFMPRHDPRLGKFKAYYSWSRGPSQTMLLRFAELGFEVVRYTGYFGHGYYSRRFPWLHRIEMRKSQWLLRHPFPQLCSYATVVLRKMGG